jgi:hypothetical protein
MKMLLRRYRWNVKLKKQGNVLRTLGDGVEESPKHAFVNERNFMQSRLIVVVKRMVALALMAVAFSLFMAGCATQSTAPTPPPAPGSALPPPTQAVLVAPSLTSDQMTRLSKENPETCQRIQTLQPLTVEDVKVMARLGFGSDVIINQVRNSHTVFHLTANAIIDLKNSGVSDQVIDFLISTPSSIAGSSPEVSSNSAAQVPPPPPPAETPPPAPGADYVWVGGDWVWNGGWVWYGGYWAYPPYPGAIWLHGGWRHGWYGGYRHYPGRWRR